MDNLAIAMENMPEEDSKKIYSVFTTEKSKAFPPGPPKNEGGPYRQYIQASEDSDILNCQYVQNLNNGLIDINSRDFEKNITISESSETFALHSKIASECNMNSVLERIADDSLSKLSNPNLDIAGPSINIVCNLLTNQHLNLIIFNKIKDNSSVPRHNLFLSRHCSPELINDSINQNPTSKMLYGAARGFNTFPETLKELVNHEDHEDPCVCAAAIQNPNTPLEAILEKLKKLNVNNELLKGETGNNPKVQKILTACFLYANQRMQRIKSSPSAAAGY
jgi:hypothetical protein